MNLVTLTEPGERWLGTIHRNYLIRRAEVNRALEGAAVLRPSRPCHACRAMTATLILQSCGCGFTEFQCRPCLHQAALDVTLELDDYLSGLAITPAMRERERAVQHEILAEVGGRPPVMVVERCRGGTDAGQRLAL